MDEGMMERKQWGIGKEGGKWNGEEEEDEGKWKGNLEWRAKAAGGGGDQQKQSQKEGRKRSLLSTPIPLLSSPFRLIFPSGFHLIFPSFLHLFPHQQWLNPLSFSFGLPHSYEVKPRRTKQALLQFFFLSLSSSILIYRLFWYLVFVPA
jgi:hypothetical protein